MINPFHIARATTALQQGGVIGYATEAVWGLGCDPLNEQAALHLLTMKQRDWRKGMILIAASIEQLQPYLHGLTPAQLSNLQNSWPGPYTWLVPDNGAAPHWVTGGRDTLAVRVTAHPQVAALCRSFGGAIISTSANTTGRNPARTAMQVRRYFQGQLDDILPGQVGGADKPTTIRHLLTGATVRPG